MERVKAGGKWSLICPNECQTLSEVYGQEFKNLYESLEEQGLYVKQVDARTLWDAILTSQIETGTPYLLYKDPINLKSNQKNLGTIKSSNLYTEIIEYSSPVVTLVCNLASVALKKFLVQKDLSNVRLRIYSKPNCIYCKMAKNLCDKLNVNYEVRGPDDLTLCSNQL